MRKLVRPTVVLFLLILLATLLMSTYTLALYRGDSYERSIFDANDFRYNTNAYSTTSDLTVDFGSDEVSSYVRFTADIGTYGNEDLILSLVSSMLEVNPIDSPYIKIAYKADTEKTNSMQLDIFSKNGQCWLASGVSLLADGAWHETIINLSSILDSSAADNYPSADDLSTVFKFKLWGSHSKTLTREQSLQIRYVAFFDSLSSAEAFEFTPMSDADYRSLFELDEVDVENASESEIRAYLSSVSTLKNEILSSTSSVSVTGNRYYVSDTSGNDSNSGLSPSDAWKTVAKVNSTTFSAGDGVYFERGGLWREQLKTQNGVTYSAYGTGEKPRLYGSVDGVGAEKWTMTDSENVWEFNEEFTDRYPANIVFNNETAWGIKVEKDPNNTGYRLDKGTCWNGIEYVDNSALPFIDMSDLAGNLEFWYDSSTHKLYLYCDYANPGTYFDTLEICLSGNGVNSVGGSKNVTIDNLCIKYFANHGISAFNTNNYTVQYCVIGFIGGNGLGNAVESWTNADNFVVHHNYAYQCYDCAYTAQGTVTDNDITIKNVRMYDNIAEYCNSGLEFWLSTSEYYHNLGKSGVMRDIDLYNNYTLYAGYGWSSQRSNKDYNFFYGGLGTSYTDYNNINIHDNVNMFTKRIGILANHISKYSGYTFYDNAYVITPSISMYNTSSLLCDFMCGKTSFYKANEYTIAKLAHYGVDNGSSFRLVSENYLPFGFNGVYDILLGDIDGNGSILPTDAIIMSRYVSLMDRGDAVFLEKNADLNDDDKVNSLDAVILMRFLASWSGYTSLPYNS